MLALHCVEPITHFVERFDKLVQPRRDCRLEAGRPFARRIHWSCSKCTRRTSVGHTRVRSNVLGRFSANAWGSHPMQFASE